jgi:aldehyde dehydrogenase (NAD+)
MDHYRLFIGGEFVESVAGDRFESLDPGSGEPIASVARAGKQDAEAAIDAARRAFDSGIWSRRTPAERAEVLLELADSIQANTPRLAGIEARDSGAIISRTLGDVFMGAKFVRSMANYAANHFPWREEIPFRNFPFHSLNHLSGSRSGSASGSFPGISRF